MTEQEDFEYEALDHLDVVTYNALERNGKNTYTALRNTTFSDLVDIRNVGILRIGMIAALMKAKGHGDAPWVLEYDQRIAAGLRVVRGRGGA